MKKFLKWAGIIFGSLVLLMILWGYFASESKPTSNPSPEADAMAQDMLSAVNKVAWDTTKIIQWSFPRGHDYLWDKERNFVQVTVADSKVLLNTKKVDGIAYSGDTQLSGDEASKAIQNAWSLFCNDSWWLNAAVKANDIGTKRSIVKVEDGREGLMVEYDGGGVTPGDAYVWFLDDQGLPTSYKMWVSIIPIGGLEFTWEDYMTLPSGAKVAQMHKGPMAIPITNIKSGDNFSAFGLNSDPFEGL